MVARAIETHEQEDGKASFQSNMKNGEDRARNSKRHDFDTCTNIALPCEHDGKLRVRRIVISISVSAKTASCLFQRRR